MLLLLPNVRSLDVVERSDKSLFVLRVVVASAGLATGLLAPRAAGKGPRVLPTFGARAVGMFHEDGMHAVLESGQSISLDGVEKRHNSLHVAIFDWTA